MNTEPYRPPPPEKQSVLFADEDLIVVDKPSGLLSVPGRGPDKADCALSYAEQAFGRALTVHRLDMDTSGILLFARTKSSQSFLSKQFELRRVVKMYEAVTEGSPSDAAGTIDLPIAKYSKNRPIRHIEPGGQQAITRWNKISQTPSTGRLKLQPETGRSHQLRLHLSAAGYPILGDPLYGDARSAPRLLLHATRLEIPHPTKLNIIRFDAPAAF